MELFSIRIQRTFQLVSTFAYFLFLFFFRGQKGHWDIRFFSLYFEIRMATLAVSRRTLHLERPPSPMGISSVPSYRSRLDAAP